MLKSRSIIMLLVTAVAACNLVFCGIPKDPHKTLENIKRLKEMRVGISDNYPWTYFINGRPAGVEVRLVEEMAKQMGAQIIWQQGDEYNLMQLLKENQIDLLVAGLRAESPYSKEVGFTKQYITSPIYIGLPPMAGPPQKLKHMRIAVRKDTDTGALVSRKGATPVMVDNLASFGGLAAGYPGELKRAGKQISDIKLGTEKHVIAVPPGENAWMVFLQKFLITKKNEIPGLLESEFGQ